MINRLLVLYEKVTDGKDIGVVIFVDDQMVEWFFAQRKLNLQSVLY